MNRNMEMPAVRGEVVTTFHANVCGERGHAVHTVAGKDTGVCPRCGEVKDTELSPETARKFADMFRLETAVRSWQLQVAMGPNARKPYAAKMLAQVQDKLSKKIGTLTPEEGKAYGKYRLN